MALPAKDHLPCSACVTIFATFSFLDKCCDCRLWNCHLNSSLCGWCEERVTSTCPQNLGHSGMTCMPLARIQNRRVERKDPHVGLGPGSLCSLPLYFACKTWTLQAARAGYISFFFSFLPLRVTQHIPAEGKTCPWSRPNTWSGMSCFRADATGQQDPSCGACACSSCLGRRHVAPGWVAAVGKWERAEMRWCHVSTTFHVLLAGGGLEGGACRSRLRLQRAGQRGRGQALEWLEMW